MSVAIHICSGKEVLECIPLSNQRFIEKWYVPTAEMLKLQHLPLIIRAAGLFVDSTNRDDVIIELATLDRDGHKCVSTRLDQSVRRVNECIRRAALVELSDPRLSLYIG